MGSEAMKLPIIDFTNLRGNDSPKWESTKTQILEALQEYGCFVATFDGIPLPLMKSVLEGIEQLFDLPLTTKQRNTYDKPNHGYVGPNEYIPLYEGLGIDLIMLPGIVDEFTNLMWPQGNPTFSKNMQLYSEQLSELDKIVRRMVLESLGLENYFDEHMNSTDYAARVQKYEPPQSLEPKVGLVPHSDKNMVTILHELNGVGGIEVLTKNGKNWIAANITSPNSFLVMMGTSIHAWTNGRLHAPYHRVMMTGDKVRYSFGMFSEPKVDCVIKAPEEMVDEEHPLMYKPFVYSKYLHFQLSEAGLASPDALKEYCGV